MLSTAVHQNSNLVINTPNSIGLWFCRIEQVNDECLQACQGLLDDSELARLQRFKSEKKARSYVVGHGLLRQVLSLYNPTISPKEWGFALGEHGKPYVATLPQLYFNLSHCDDAVALAVTTSAEVGVDIESLNRSHNIDGIIKRYFHSGEQEHLLSLTAEAQKVAFYHYWTLKEAYSKGTSLGLAHTLDSFSVNLGDIPHIKSSADDHWQFALCMPDDSLVLAASINRPSIKIQWQIFEYIPFTSQLRQVTDFDLMRISA